MQKSSAGRRRSTKPAPTGGGVRFRNGRSNTPWTTPFTCHPLCEPLEARLGELGRLDWMDEEMADWKEELRRTVLARSVGGGCRAMPGLDARSLAIVRELWKWRDAEARRRDQPARRVLRDDLIVELARRQTADAKRIRAVRGMERGDLLRRVDDIAAAIQRALRCPRSNARRGRRASPSPQLSVLGQFLFAALGSICRQARLSPNLVGGPNDIRDLIVFRDNPAREGRRRRGWPAAGGRSSSAGSSRTCWPARWRSGSAIRSRTIRWCSRNRGEERDSGIGDWGFGGRQRMKDQG